MIHHTQTLLRHPSLTVTVKDGTEGPSHDPYHVVEYHVRTPKGVTVYHCGLGVWVSHNGHKIDMVNFNDDDTKSQWIEKVMFPEIVGFTPKQLHRMFRKRTQRCRACGRREFSRAFGHPGETLYFCTRCGEVATTYQSTECL